MSSFPWTSLPDELSTVILKLVDVPTLCSMRVVSRSLLSSASSDDVWLSKYVADHGSLPVTETMGSVMMLYREAALRKNFRFGSWFIQYLKGHLYVWNIHNTEGVVIWVPHRCEVGEFTMHCMGHLYDIRFTGLRYQTVQIDTSSDASNALLPPSGLPNFKENKPADAHELTAPLVLRGWGFYPNGQTCAIVHPCGRLVLSMNSTGNGWMDMYKLRAAGDGLSQREQQTTLWSRGPVADFVKTFFEEMCTEPGPVVPPNNPYAQVAVVQQSVSGDDDDAQDVADGWNFAADD